MVSDHPVVSILTHAPLAMRVEIMAEQARRTTADEPESPCTRCSDDYDITHRSATRGDVAGEERAVSAAGVETQDITDLRHV